MKASLITSLCLTVSLFTFPLAFQASAEEVKLPVGQQAAEKQTLARPKQGMNKAQVEAKFGRPLNLLGTVGEPPISAWEYADFVVYFEHDLVLHTVLKDD